MTTVSIVQRVVTINVVGGGAVQTEVSTALEEIRVLRSWTAVSDDYTAIAGARLRLDSTVAGFTVTIPDPPEDGDEILLEDWAGETPTHAVLVDAGASLIDGSAAPYTIDFAGVRLLGLDGAWQVRRIS